MSINVQSILFILIFISMLIKVFIVLSFLSFVRLIQVPPTWVTSNLIKADHFYIINNVLTGSSSSPTASITFSSAFPSIPNLAFGISRYEANDQLLQEFFEINRTALTSASFSIKLQIVGFTNLWYLRISYIAIDISFPHRVNSFDNVPVNYSNGNIVNLTTMSGTQFYQNTINFTAQAIASGFSYKNFNLPLSGNKILLFMTSLYQRATADSPPTYYPLELKVIPTVLTNQTYLLNASYGIKAEITRLHFSMLIYDQNDILASNLYQAVYTRVQFTASGGFIQIPIQFITNMIIGFVQYSSTRSNSSIHFTLDFKNDSNGIYGVSMPVSTPKSLASPLSRFTFNIFYLRTWICQVGTIFDNSISLCISCPITGCITCLNKTVCTLCDSNLSYTLDNTTGQCKSLTPTCGDNIFQAPQECDDGNLQPGDGCSSDCKIQANFSCEPNNASGFSNSLCFYSGQITLNVVYIQKINLKNQIEILLQITPSNLAFWDNVNFAQMVTLSNVQGFQSYDVIRNQDGTVSILINYISDIQNLQVTVELDPSKSGQATLSKIPPSSKNFQIIPDNNEAAVFYEEYIYQIALVVQILAYLVAGLSLFIFIIGIFGGRLVGVEMMAVIQISYLSLLMLSELNPCLKSLADIWFVNGINYYSIKNNRIDDQLTTIQMKRIRLYSCFFQNYNLTMGLLTLPFIFSLIFFILSKLNIKNDYKLKMRLQDWAKRCNCQFAYNFIMFSGYIIAISSALELGFGIRRINETIGIVSLVQCFTLLGIYILYFVLIIKMPQYFGEYIFYFKQKSSFYEMTKQKYFQKKNIKQQKKSIQVRESWKQIGSIDRKWYNVLMIQRMLIGVCLIYALSPIFIIAVFFVLIIGVIIRRPYVKLMHNIRFIANMVISIVIQGIYLGYKVTPLSAQSSNIIWFVLPIMVCVLLLICIIYSAIIIIYELCERIKKQKVEETRIAQQQELKMWLSRQIANTNNITPNTKKPLIITQEPIDNNSKNHPRDKFQELKQIKKKIRDDFADYQIY